MTKDVQKPQLTGSLYLFSQPEILSRAEHKGVGLTKVDTPYAFCARTRSVPITLSEFHAASKHYPIIFSSAENPIPLAVLGLQDEVNLFVDSQGKWDADSYVPGYIRRYPFAFAKQEDGERYALVIDKASNLISDNPETPFFRGEALSDEVKKVTEFCRIYEQDRLATIAFSEKLKSYDILTNQAVHYTPESGKEQQPFASFVGADDKKLQALEDGAFLELRKNNMLAMLYVQLSSMSNWRQLLGRRTRYEKDAKENGKDAAKPSVTDGDAGKKVNPDKDKEAAAEREAGAASEDIKE